ncbi:MAG: ATP-dependent sacrificial sulfur transferase LarE [Chloroflexi bacterium]|nr:ATP-dependent sacrificial sulfur transferase LarE [Chloroflexota bacterium]
MLAPAPSFVPISLRADPRTTEQKLADLQNVLRGYESVVVAFSAGADSTLVAKVAADVLGDRALAVTSASESLAERELDEALQYAESLRITHRVIYTQELQNPDYLANPTNRCYHCKTELYDHLVELARQEGFRHVANGLNLDDLGDYRPGLQAANEHDVRAPLQEAGLTKPDVRAISRLLDVPTWDKPAMACLSSRVPYGEAITPEKLRQIDHAEQVLRDLGYRQLRVRHHGQVARIELPADQLTQFVAEHAALVSERLKAFGFLYVTLDLQGFRSGSMNDVLKRPAGGTHEQPDRRPSGGS